MKVLVAKVALISLFAFVAFSGGGVALDSGQVQVTGPQSAEARMGWVKRCVEHVDPDGSVWTSCWWVEV